MILRARFSFISVAVLATCASAFAACGGSDNALVGGDGPEAAPRYGSEGGPASDGGGPVADDDSGARNVAVGGACTKDSDCVTGGCDYTLHCAAAASCTQHNGGDTCGATGKESCCTSIAVPKPGAAYKLDKFNITAGRMRVFVEKTKGDIRGYIQKNRPAWFEPAWDPWLPNVMDDGTAVTGDSHLFDTGKGQDGVYQQLGPIHYGAAEEGGNEGCLTKQVGNARTYRLPRRREHEALRRRAAVPAGRPRSEVPAVRDVLHGRRVLRVGRRTHADDRRARLRVGRRRPDHAPVSVGQHADAGRLGQAVSVRPDRQGLRHRAARGLGSEARELSLQLLDAPEPCSASATTLRKCDYSLYIAPPGTFPSGNGPFGHSDLAGNVYNVALPMSGTPGTDPATKRTVGLNRTGAFDGHAIPNKHPIQGFRTWASTNKYLAVGGRCARD